MPQVQFLLAHTWHDKATAAFRQKSYHKRSSLHRISCPHFWAARALGRFGNTSRRGAWDDWVIPWRLIPLHLFGWSQRKHVWIPHYSSQWSTQNFHAQLTDWLSLHNRGLWINCRFSLGSYGFKCHRIQRRIYEYRSRKNIRLQCEPRWHRDTLTS